MTPEEQAALAAAKAERAETRRPTVPGIEALLFEPLPCLDHGFVRVVDYMGDDAAIVQAARVSYGKGTRAVSEDRALLRYLLRHRHTSPFEMCELKIHVKMPIFVARQWIRHRTACLAADSQLWFDLPGGSARGRRQRHNVRIGDLHRMWHEGTSHPLGKKKPLYLDRVDVHARYTIPDLARLVERREEDLRNLVRRGSLTGEREGGRIYVEGASWHAWATRVHTVKVDMRERLSAMKLRMCDEETGEIRATSIVDIWETGTRPVFRMTLENGYSLTMTKDHRCLTTAGWRTLEEATGLSRSREGGVSWRTDAPAFAVNGIPAHRDEAWLQARRAEGLDLQGLAEQAGVSTHTIRKSLRRFGLQFSAKERARLSGRAQRGQKRAVQPRVWTAEAVERVRAARSGARSNFWKGGTTSERANIGRWTTEHAARVHARHGWRCVLCGGKDRLHAHHGDPVWHAPDLAREEANLFSVCTPCHQRLHGDNLELAFLEAVKRGLTAEFWLQHPNSAPRPEGKRRPRAQKLIRAWSSVARIEYVGEEPTYDLEVAGPWHNFVANGLVVHNSVNESSARYSIMDKEFYLPRPEDLAVQSKDNKQGRGDALTMEAAAEVLHLLRRDAETAYATYEELLEGKGLARELARMNLPLSMYTQWYWKIDLHNLLHFLSLRIDRHAQYEIRVYAEAIGKVLEAWVPTTWEAFKDYKIGAVTLSAQMLDVVRRLVRGETPTREESGLSKREWDELMEILAR